MLLGAFAEVTHHQQEELEYKRLTTEHAVDEYLEIKDSLRKMSELSKVEVYNEVAKAKQRPKVYFSLSAERPDDIAFWISNTFDHPINYIRVEVTELLMDTNRYGTPEDPKYWQGKLKETFVVDDLLGKSASPFFIRVSYSKQYMILKFDLNWSNGSYLEYHKFERNKDGIFEVTEVPEELKKREWGS